MGQLDGKVALDHRRGVGDRQGDRRARSPPRARGSAASTSTPRGQAVADAVGGIFVAGRRRRVERRRQRVRRVRAGARRRRHRVPQRRDRDRPSPTSTALTDDVYRRIMRVNVDGVVFGHPGRDPGACSAAAAARSSRPARSPGSSRSRPTRSTTSRKHAVVGFIRSVAPTLARARHHREHGEPGHDRHEHPHRRGQGSSSPRPTSR